MIRKLIFQILLRWVMKECREVMKLDAQQELWMQRLASDDDTVKLLKSRMTAFTMMYFEAPNDMERQMVKGAALAMRTLLMGKQIAEKIFHDIDDDDERVKEWKKKFTLQLK